MAIQEILKKKKTLLIFYEYKFILCNIFDHEFNVKNILTQFINPHLFYVIKKKNTTFWSIIKHF